MNIQPSNVHDRLAQLTLDSERNRFRDELAMLSEYIAAAHNRTVKLVEDSKTMPPDEMRCELEATQLILHEADQRLDVEIVRTLIMQAIR